MTNKIEIPAGVYYKSGNFYNATTNRGMGQEFWDKWHPHRRLFPYKVEPFDKWVSAHLHAMYDSVLVERIPNELIEAASGFDLVARATSAAEDVPVLITTAPAKWRSPSAPIREEHDHAMRYHSTGRTIAEATARLMAFLEHQGRPDLIATIRMQPRIYVTAGGAAEWRATAGGRPSHSSRDV
jgi:hypothetical protein